jgi:hypothetical protein
MLRKTVVALAFALAVGGTALSTNAFARGQAGHGFHRNSFAGNMRDSHVTRDGYGGYDRNLGGPDVWGHWGAYYGPMVGPI